MLKSVPVAFAILRLTLIRIKRSKPEDKAHVAKIIVSGRTSSVVE